MHPSHAGNLKGQHGLHQEADGKNARMTKLHFLLLCVSIDPATQALLLFVFILKWFESHWHYILHRETARITF